MLQAKRTTSIAVKNSQIKKSVSLYDNSSNTDEENMSLKEKNSLGSSTDTDDQAWKRKERKTGRIKEKIMLTIKFFFYRIFPILVPSCCKVEIWSKNFIYRKEHEEKG